jgi:translation elongation factor EF-1alpha
LLRNIDKDFLEDNFVLAPENLEYKFGSIIRARLLVLEGSFVPGSSVVLHCGASYTTAHISQITEILRMSPKHKKISRMYEDKFTIAFEGELIEADFTIDTAIVVEKFSDFPELGRVILRHSGHTIAVGIVNDLINE